MPRVELKQDGTLSVVENEHSFWLSIITPNKHKLSLSYTGEPNCEWDEILNVEHVQNKFHNDNEFLTILESLPSSKFILVLAYEGRRLRSIYHWATQTWHPCSCSEQLANVLAEYEQSLINYIWAYDRECENAKWLKTIGTFFQNCMDRADILDMFTHVAANITESSPKSGDQAK